MLSLQTTCHAFPGRRRPRYALPLNPAGGEGALIQGRDAILKFYVGILPGVGGVKFLRCYLSDSQWAAGQAEIGLANGNTRYALDAFRIENREIKEQQNHYDSRSTTG